MQSTWSILVAVFAKPLITNQDFKTVLQDGEARPLSHTAPYKNTGLGNTPQSVLSFPVYFSLCVLEMSSFTPMLIHHDAGKGRSL